MKRTTESDSLYDGLEHMPVSELLTNINKEDAKVALVVASIIPDIGRFVEEAAILMKEGGRLFYLGAGTSGRLGIVDASECPPTYGVQEGVVIGLIAGGDTAIRKAVEFAEDDDEQAWKDLLQYNVSARDVVVGIAASGTTPYVVGALRKAQEEGILTACITCNPGGPVTKYAQHPLVAEVGPEFVTGSTRMKAGTAQKLILNMISTSLMIQLGRVRGNKMVDMQLSNNKLVDRGNRMIMKELGVTEDVASTLLKEYGTVRKAIDNYKEKKK